MLGRVPGVPGLIKTHTHLDRVRYCLRSNPGLALRLPAAWPGSSAHVVEPARQLDVLRCHCFVCAGTGLVGLVGVQVAQLT